MAYGVALGQTPILNANGVTYDNSSTSDVISGTNVQTAIDDIANKVKENESSGGLQWVKLGERQLKSEKAVTLNTELVLGDSFVNTDNCLALMNLISGTINLGVPNDFQLFFGRVPIINYASESLSFNNLCVIATKYMNRGRLGFNAVVDTYNDMQVSEMTDAIKAVNRSSSRFSYDFTQYVYGLKLL